MVDLPDVWKAFFVGFFVALGCVKFGLISAAGL